MANPPAYDRRLLIPVGVGIFSLIGICSILVWGRINATRAAIEEVPTATVFQYALIGTEPAISTVTLEGTADQEAPTFAPEIPTSAPISTPVQLPTNTLASVITLPPLENTSTPTRTPTSASTAPFGPGTFDNTDSRFVYSGGWDPLSGVPGAYQNTLHVSDTLLSSVTFRFIGNELRVESETMDEHTLRVKVKDLDAGYYLISLRDEQSKFQGVYKFLKR